MDMPTELREALTAWVLHEALRTFAGAVAEKAQDEGTISVEQMMRLEALAVELLDESFGSAS